MTSTATKSERSDHQTFQPWKYGTFFMYYDITGPFHAPDAAVRPNEKGGFFGSWTVTLSSKQIGQALTGQKWDWGALGDISLKYELETVSKFGMLNYTVCSGISKYPGSTSYRHTTRHPRRLVSRGGGSCRSAAPGR